MSKVYALLVGIDAYQPPVPVLHGSVNDIALAERLLRDRIAPGDLDLRTLIDEEATRAEIIRSFRVHLGRAGPGDIALFWFSGHGSTGPLPDELRLSEGSGRCQTTVCYDSRHGGVPDIYDKEFAVLVHEVVAGGAQLVSIKDSCHARSGMREIELPPRYAEPSPVPPAVRDLLPELLAAAATPAPRHIALSACDEHEVARERSFRRTVQGVFSEAVCRAVTRLGDGATYRQVLSEARCLVEGRYPRQVPSLEADGDDANRVFLGGAIRPRAAQVTLRHIRDEWEVDVGALHGVPGPQTRFARHGEKPLQEVRVTQVHAERSVVVPVDWTPDEREQYDMVLTRVPLPPVGVVLDGPVAGLPAALAASPHVRLIPPGDATEDQLLLRVRETAGHLEITSADDQTLASPPDVAGAVADLEHMARWMQIRNLTNPRSTLQNAVVVEVVPAGPDDETPLRDRPALPAGDVVMEYTRVDGEWVPPSVFIRLRNTTSRPLYCVLLDLTDRFRMHAKLFPGEHIAPGWAVAAGRGNRIKLTLPPGRCKKPGAYGTDWLMLLVAEERFSSDPFALPRLGETSRGPHRSDRPGIAGILDGLGWRAVHRGDDEQPSAALDWATTVVELRTTIPQTEHP